MFNNIKSMLFLLNLFFVNTVFSKDFGVIGPVYPIVESDLLVDMQSKFSAEKSVIEEKLQQQQIKAHALMDRPEPLAIPKTQNPKRTAMVIAPGYTGTLEKEVLFYNADDAEQVKWAQQWDTQLQGKDKLILVGGSVFSQMRLFQKSVYFDQGGRITQELKIGHVPARVFQEGTVLVISEERP